MRRLPVYLMLDVSGSMLGEPIEAVRNGIGLLLANLRQDPYALETAYLSVITFSSEAKQVIPLTELTAIQSPAIAAGGTTSMGAGLCVLARAIGTEVRKGAADAKGDWKPVVFLLSDGGATDDLAAGIAALKNVRTAAFVACAVGARADVSELRRITETVVSLDTADASSLMAFFRWVSASISTTSQKVDLNKEVGGLSDLPPPPPEVNVLV